MLDVLYASFHCSEKMFEEMFKNSEQKPGQAVQKYNRLLAEGLAKHKNINVSVVCEMPITEENYEKRFFHKEEERDQGVHYIYIPLINRHRIKDVMAIITTFFTCISFFIDRKEIVVMADILNAPVALGAYLASKLCGKRYIALITDAPQFVFSDSDRAYRLVSDFLIKRASAYIFLTQQMNELFNKKDQPYTIIEGLVDYRMDEKPMNSKTDNKGKKICMYTGSIHQIYGIQNLINGFVEADMEDAELHIYGEGDYKEQLIKICEMHTNIKYFGNILSRDVIEKQKEATLLINPRPIHAEFTKYSFPSKNMEYMVSGTPVLTTKLPGMPKEYHEYVFLVEDDSQEGIKNALQKVLNLDTNTLLEKGSEARKFVLNKKNNMVQAEKILDLSHLSKNRKGARGQ